MEFIDELSEAKGWGCQETSYFEEIIDRTTYLFGYDNLPDFELAEDYGYGDNNINNYIHMALENYSDLFFDSAIYNAELESDYDLLSRVRDEYEGLDIYVDCTDSGIDLESGIDIVNLNSVEDYLDMLR